MIKRRTYTLRFILEWLVVISVLVTMLIGLVSSIHVNEASLSASYLENNFRYAKKLAGNTTEVVSGMQNTVNALAMHTAEHPFSNKDLDDWFSVNKQYFQSLFIADAHGIIRQVSPSVKGIQPGTQLTSPASQQALRLKQPFISEPYYGKAGHLIILVSSPIVDQQGTYQGFVGGTIYLEEENALNRTLEEHIYGDGSYVFVVDKTGRLIFHPEKKRLGDIVTMNPAVKQALEGKSGYAEIVNSKGVSFLAGYSHEKITGWGIISQTPRSVLDKSNRQLVGNLLLTALPFLLVTVAIVWLISKNISSSLSKLALFSDRSVESGGDEPEIPTTTSSIYEVQKLYQSTRMAIRKVNKRLTQLQAEVRTDGLTGLANRKTFDAALQERIRRQAPFSLVLLDIDHFKKVNDSFGHVTGDEVLKQVAKTMLEQTREDDLCFRYGGEEFGILIDDEHVQLAWHIAERLRTAISSQKQQTGTSITISSGVANFPLHGARPVEIVSMADQALYQSKADGRNRTTLFQPKEARSRHVR